MGMGVGRNVQIALVGVSCGVLVDVGAREVVVVVFGAVEVSLGVDERMDLATDPEDVKVPKV